jgi:hypothetical protein
MQELVGYCGVVCSECPAYLATQSDDQAARQKVADMWKAQFHTEVKAEDVNCDGCLATGKRQVGYCAICEIRKCGSAKNIFNCAFCTDYPCEKLVKWQTQAPKTKAKLETFRKKK